MSEDIKFLDMIIQDMEDDVARHDGAPFNGRTLATIHGELAATIQALARIMRNHIKPLAELDTPKKEESK